VGFKDFVAGFILAPIVGIPLAFHNAYLGTFVGVFIGALVSSSKKGGGVIGFLTAPIIYLSSFLIPQVMAFLSGELNPLYLGLLLILSFLDINILEIAIACLVLGIIVGHIGGIKKKKEKEEEVEEESFTSL